MLRTDDRLDDVTADAELQEKSAADVSSIVNLLLNQCHQAVKEHEDKNKEMTPTGTQQSQTQSAAERTYVTTVTVVFLSAFNN